MKQKLVILAIIITIVFFTFGKYIFTNESLTIKVTDKNVIVKDGKSKYLVNTTTEVFENTDYWQCLKFNSSDVQNNLIKDSTYKVKVIGWRIPFLSKYRNIIKIE
jgi:hypothetical protein